MILCSVSIQVSSDLVVFIIASEQGFALAFSLLLCCFFFSSYWSWHQPSWHKSLPDKLKMIDSESKMGMAKQGVSPCPHLCPCTSTCLKRTHVRECCSAPLRLYRRVSAVAEDNVWAQYACTLVVNARRRMGLQHWFPDTFKECEKTANIRFVNLKSHQRAFNALSCVSCQHQLKAWNSGPKSVKIHQEQKSELQIPAWAQLDKFRHQHTICRPN